MRSTLFSAFLFPPLRERWHTMVIGGTRSGKFPFTPLRERWQVIKLVLVKRDMFLFPPLHERWQRKSASPLPILSFHSHLWVRGDNTIAQHFMSVDIRFNSHLCVRGDKKLNTRTKNIIVSIHTSAWEVTEMAREISNELMQFPFTPLRERWRQGNFCKSHEGNVSIPTSEWEVTYYGTAFHECGHSFLFPPLRERWHEYEASQPHRSGFHSHLCVRGDWNDSRY